MEMPFDRLVRALSLLPGAAAMEEGVARRVAAREAAFELDRLGVNEWLPHADMSYYQGAALLAAGELDAADRALACVSSGPCGGEAVWLRSGIVAGRIEQGADSGMRAVLFHRYRRLAEICPLSPLVQTAVDYEAECAEREAPRNEPRSIPAVRLGRRHRWQTLVRIGEMYRRQRLWREAAQAYLWSAEVRYPAEWLHPAAAVTWASVSECYEQAGDEKLAMRWLAKCFALPLEEQQVVRAAQGMRRVHSAPAVASGPAMAEAGALLHIAELLMDMEIFDAALAALEHAGRLGADVGVARAGVMERKAAFLRDYRQVRGASTVLMDGALTWDRVGQAFREARDQYAAAADGNAGVSEGVRRCEDALTELRRKEGRQP